MRAIVVRQPGPAADVMVLEQIPDPTPGRGQVVIEVAACGVCFHDIVTRNGTLKAGIEMPLIPGHEIAGTVAAVGPDVVEVKLGDRVATAQRSHVCGSCRYCRTAREPLCEESVFLGDVGLNGGYAEYVAVDQDSVAVVPDDVALEAAAIAACAIGTVFHALVAIGRVGLGERVLVTGAGGGLGLHAVQLAKRVGAFVIAQTTSPGKVAMIREAGADAVVAAERGGDFSADVRAAAGGAGVDVVIDTVGTPVFQPTRRSLAKGGRWVLIGQLTGDFVPFNPAQLFLRGISLLSATSTTRNELRQVLDLQRPGGIRTMVDKVMPLEGAAQAHALVEGGKAAGRIVLSPAMAPGAAG